MKIDQKKPGTKQRSSTGKPGEDIQACARCGTCCRKGGPSFHQADKKLIEKGLISSSQLYTIREGELAHDNVKQAILNATELDTRLVMRPLRNTERVLTNEAVERLLETERKLGSDIKFEDIANEVAGVYPRVMQQGEMDVGAWSCGMVAGLINDIPSCAELIERIMREADALISQRLEGLRSGATMPA